MIEPLRSQESNIINSAAEGFELVKAINDPNFELLIDFYHLASEKEDPAIILRANEHIRHLHMANPQGRVFPSSGTSTTTRRFSRTFARSGMPGGSAWKPPARTSPPKRRKPSRSCAEPSPRAPADPLMFDRPGIMGRDASGRRAEDPRADVVRRLHTVMRRPDRCVHRDAARSWFVRIFGSRRCSSFLEWPRCRRWHRSRPARSPAP